MARLQGYLGVRGDATYMTQLELTARAAIEARTGLYFGEEKDFVDVRDIPARPSTLTSLELDEPLPSIKLSCPVVDLADVTFEERVAQGSAWETTEQESEDDPPLPVFEISGVRVTRVIGAWPAGKAVVRASYEFGYAEDAGPAEVEAVLFDLIGAWYQDPAVRKMGVRAAGVTLGGGVSITMQGGGTGYGIPNDLLPRILALRPGGSF